ncbi:hypothetical protein [Brevundimonas sp. TWP3-1-2b1]|uniref:hypothetical protein n=1 Tax=Brevundimonas sp. TWP3-1-2b1 TaxID=2804650 RepID=UPI003CEB72C4
MIDHLFQELFPPVWVKETEDTLVLFRWLAEPVDADAASALLVANGGDSAVITADPTPNGSRLFPAEAGMVLHLSAADAASIKSRTVVLALWLDGQVMSREPDTTGQVIVSDWAFAPAEGHA